MRYLYLIALLVCLHGCAVTQLPTQLDPITAELAGEPRTLAKTVQLDLSTGYSRVLGTGSRWQPIGRVAQGDVYRPVQDVFTIEGAHIHEAYLVLDKGLLVGFYLPAERSFSPLRDAVHLSFK